MLHKSTRRIVSMVDIQKGPPPKAKWVNEVISVTILTLQPKVLHHC